MAASTPAIDGELRSTLHFGLTKARPGTAAHILAKEVQRLSMTPNPVWVVYRPDTGSIEAFEDEYRAREYAGFYDGAQVACCEVMNDSAAGQFFIDTVHGEQGEAT